MKLEEIVKRSLEVNVFVTKATEKRYTVYYASTQHMRWVSRRKKKTCFARKGTSVATQKIYTHNSAEQLKRLKNRFFALSLSENKTFLFLFLSFFFAAFLRSICCALNAFSNGTPARNYQHCYILVSRYAVCQFHGSYSATGPQHRYRKRSLCKNKGQGTNRPFNSLPVWWRSAESPGKNLTSCLRK